MYVCMYVCTYVCMYHSFIVVTMNIRDRYQVIGRREISNPIKQPCRSASLKKALEMHQKC